MKVTIGIITASLILLWVYSTYSKLKKIKKFRKDLKTQAYPPELGDILFLVLPVSEIGAAVLLLFKSTRLLGMYLSFLMMLLFTCYIAGAVVDFYRRYPCPCGGIFRHMAWRTHLKINLVYTIIALAGIILMECSA